MNAVFFLLYNPWGRQYCFVYCFDQEVEVSLLISLKLLKTVLEHLVMFLTFISHCINIRFLKSKIVMQYFYSSNWKKNYHLLGKWMGESLSHILLVVITEREWGGHYWYSLQQKSNTAFQNLLLFKSSMGKISTCPNELWKEMSAPVDLQCQRTGTCPQRTHKRKNK